VFLARERSSDIGGKATNASLVGPVGLWGKSNESQLANRRGLSTRVEFDEVGESVREGADDEEAAFGDEVFESRFDVGCDDGCEGDGTAGVGLVTGVGMVEVTEGLPWAAKARTTAS
jgi:hypothetical protein